MTGSELFATAVAALLALPVGLAFLYETNHTWGRWTDIAAAVAWGLGLQQLSGQSFSGVSDLRRRLLGET